MNQINFLPESFRKNRARSQRRPIEFVVIAATAVAMFGLWHTSSGPDRTLAAQADEIDKGIEQIEQLQQEKRQLDQQRSELQRRLIIARETYQPITVTQVLARLSELTPEAVRYVELELETKRPDPEPRPDTAKARPKRVIGTSANGKAEPPREPNLMKIQITGHAPTDDEVVTLIRRLGEDPVFTSVALRSSRVEKTKTHFVRQFRMDLVIDLDRRFVPASGERLIDED